VHLGVEKVKDDSKWCCKVEVYMEKYNMKLAFDYTLEENA
jgi:hypothetical protein